MSIQKQPCHCNENLRYFQQRAITVCIVYIGETRVLCYISDLLRLLFCIYPFVSLFVPLSLLVPIPLYFLAFLSPSACSPLYVSLSLALSFSIPCLSFCFSSPLCLPRCLALRLFLTLRLHFCFPCLSTLTVLAVIFLSFFDSLPLPPDFGSLPLFLLVFFSRILLPLSLSLCVLLLFPPIYLPPF
jgi:hypothetical protein